MEKQISTIFRKLYTVKGAAVASLLALLGVVPLPAPAQVVKSKLNPLQVALLHWYPANLTTQFQLGTNPSAVAFDGANIWVANAADNTVTKLRASDGTNLGTFAVGFSPNGLAYDGANLWVANFDGGNVTKLRASDGTTLGTFPVGTLPNALAARV